MAKITLYIPAEHEVALSLLRERLRQEGVSLSAWFIQQVNAAARPAPVGQVLGRSLAAERGLTTRH